MLKPLSDRVLLNQRLLSKKRQVASLFLILPKKSH